MTTTVIVLLGFAPGIFWLWYFYKKDKWEPEPKSLVIKTFLWGFAGALVAAILEFPFGGNQLLSVIVIAPIVEEFVKFSVVRFIMFNHEEFDEPMDGIVYAAAAALGFASIENSLYLLGGLGKSVEDFAGPRFPHESEGLLYLFTARAFLSVPGHVLFSSMWGYALGWGKFMTQPTRNRIILQGFVLAVTMHTVFNMAATISSYIPAILIVCVTLMWTLVKKRMDHALGASPHIKG